MQTCQIFADDGGSSDWLGGMIEPADRGQPKFISIKIECDILKLSDPPTLPKRPASSSCRGWEDVSPNYSHCHRNVRKVPHRILRSHRMVAQTRKMTSKSRCIEGNRANEEVTISKSDTILFKDGKMDKNSIENQQASSEQRNAPDEVNALHIEIENPPQISSGKFVSPYAQYLKHRSTGSSHFAVNFGPKPTITTCVSKIEDAIIIGKSSFRSMSTDMKPETVRITPTASRPREQNEETDPEPFLKLVHFSPQARTAPPPEDTKGVSIIEQIPRVRRKQRSQERKISPKAPTKPTCFTFAQQSRHAKIRKAQQQLYKYIPTKLRSAAVQPFSLNK
jgi:hypothetical protein